MVIISFKFELPCKFAFLAVLNGEQLLNNENIVPPLWMINSIVLVILGIFTMRRA